MLAALIAPILLAQVTAKEIFAQCSPVVVTIKTDQGGGSGFVASDTGLVYTAAHVIEGVKEAKVTFSDGTSFEATGIVDVDQVADVAIIKARFRDRPVAKLAKTNLEIGDKVFAIGAPLGLEFSITDGILSQYRDRDGIQLLQYSCATSAGNSGCPIFSSAGEVIAVHNSARRGGENTNFGVSVAALKGLDATLSTTRFTEYKWKKEEPAEASGGRTAATMSRASAVELLLTQMDKIQAIRESVYDLDIEVTTKSPGNAIVSTNVLEAPNEMAAIGLRLLTMSKSMDAELQVETQKYLLKLNDIVGAYEKLLLTFRDAQQRGWEAAITKSYNDYFGKILVSITSTEMRKLIVDAVPPEKQSQKFKYTFTGEKVKVGPVFEGLGVTTTISDFPNVRLTFVAKGSLAQKSGLQVGDQLLAIDGQELEDPFKVLGELLSKKGTQFKIDVAKHNGARKTHTVKVPK